MVRTSIYDNLRAAKLGFLLVTIVIANMFSSCDSTIHFYPEPEGNGRSQVYLDVDWSGYHKSLPTGMTVICHHQDTGEKVQVIDNNTDRVTPHLSPGRHWATVFSLTEQEYNYIGFRGLESAETAEAYIREERDPKWYQSRAEDDGFVARHPEWLAVDTIMTDHVKFTEQGAKVIGTLYPRNIIYTLHVEIHTENIGNVKSARGAISGFASGRRLASDMPNDNTLTATHLIESDDWTRTRTSVNPDKGIVKCDIRCFGLPSNHSGTPEENILEFQALLSDGKTVLKYEIPVGNLIISKDRPTGGRGENLDLYLKIHLDPPVPPGNSDGTGSGFDASIEDWDEGEDIDIGLK